MSSRSASWNKQEAAAGRVEGEMADDYDPTWIFTHTGTDMPCDSRAVTVLVALKDGTFKPDIGRYYGRDGWNLQFWKDAPVIAWTNIPSFKDDTEIVEIDEAA